MRRALLIGLCLGALLVQAAQAVESRVQQQARFDYMMHCQGCHTPDGSGASSVPQMKDRVGVFLTSEAGREYLVQVPGSATSALSDARLANVLNWIITEFSGSSRSDQFQPYTEEEVGHLRQHPLNEVARYRAQLLRELLQRSGGINE